jgi:hypothetical protein
MTGGVPYYLLIFSSHGEGKCSENERKKIIFKLPQSEKIKLHEKNVSRLKCGHFSTYITIVTLCLPLLSSIQNSEWMNADFNNNAHLKIRPMLLVQRPPFA